VDQWRRSAGLTLVRLAEERYPVSIRHGTKVNAAAEPKPFPFRDRWGSGGPNPSATINTSTFGSITSLATGANNRQTQLGGKVFF